MSTTSSRRRFSAFMLPAGNSTMKKSSDRSLKKGSPFYDSRNSKSIIKTYHSAIRINDDQSKENSIRKHESLRQSNQSAVDSKFL